MTQIFIKNKKEILITSADKGNINIFTYRRDYNKNCCHYSIIQLKNNPNSTIQNNNNKKCKKLLNRQFINENTHKSNVSNDISLI